MPFQQISLMPALHLARETQTSEKANAAVIGTDGRRPGVGAFAELHGPSCDYDAHANTKSYHRIVLRVSITALINPLSRRLPASQGLALDGRNRTITKIHRQRP